jgi:predicted metalloprotease with PDZ domain
MKNCLLLFFFFLTAQFTKAQTNTYSISFANAVHHEAEVKATFTDVKESTFSVRMSRTSPGRYAIHEFAKNVYNVVATDSKGKQLNIVRPNPYQWDITGHDGTVNVSYTLFADHGDGTYSQIDETHAHLNIPATFMFAPSQAERRVEVTFDPREDLNWKVATQLKSESGNTYSAPNLQYFMDSPTEISNWDIRQFDVESSGKKYNVRFVLHHKGTSQDLDAYFEKVKRIVLAEKDVYGELADYDYGTYTFLACYLSNVSGDGMEHRNSTILTDREGLAEGGMEGNIGTVSHEFFHSWNVERIRPQALEPFDFTEANMSGELWFAEGFTSYYTGLILCRAGVITPERYVEGLDGTFNYVWNSPARQFFNPIEMSYQAPFVDAATAVDPVNRENTFISYYSYGSILGLALDLSLRQNKLNLDDYMKLVWLTYGKNEKPYTVQDLHETLKKYAGVEFGDNFFNNYIYKSEMPDYKALLASVGVDLIQGGAPYFGASVNANDDGSVTIRRNTYIGSPAYKAGLDRGHIITAIDGMPLTTEKTLDNFVAEHKVGDKLKVTYIAFGETRTTEVELTASPVYVTQMAEKNGTKVDKKSLERRGEWLKVE